METKQKLLFVYNAKSDVFSLVTGFAHKIISPQTYQCNLCQVTYDGLRMKQQWRSFVRSLPMPVQFLHKDEFEREYPGLVSMKLPAVFMTQDGLPRILVSAPEIDKVHDIDNLIKLVNNKLTQKGGESL